MKISLPESEPEPTEPEPTEPEPTEIERPALRRRRRAASTLFPLLAAVLLVAACGTGSEGALEQVESLAAPAVEAVPARFGELPLEERLSGVVRAENQVAIHAEISAPVAQVAVKSGDAVRRGQLLVRLQDDTYRDQLRQAEANLRLAEAAAAEAEARVTERRAQVTRGRRLAEQQLISQLELETQEAQLAAIEAAAAQAAARVEQVAATVQERRTALAKTEIRAPVAGRVGQRNAEVGMLVDSGDMLFLLGNLDELIVEIPLTEGMLAYVEQGQPVQITAETLAEPLAAELSRISPFLAAGSFSTIGEIDLANRGDRLRPGMFVTVEIFYGQSEAATLLPTSALWEDPQTGVQGVYVVTSDLGPGAVEPADGERGVLPEDAQQVEFRSIEVLAEGRATIGVSGVAEGEWVVTVGQQLLASGERTTARVRPASWGQVLALQGLQREDLLARFLEKQQRLAKQLGADRLPTVEESLAGLEELTGGGDRPPDGDPQPTAMNPDAPKTVTAAAAVR